MPRLIRRAYQSAEILAALLGLGQSRIVPEYSFLDPRCELPLCPHTLMPRCRQIFCTIEGNTPMFSTS